MVEWLKEYVIRRQERVERLLYAFDVLLVSISHFEPCYQDPDFFCSQGNGDSLMIWLSYPSSKLRCSASKPDA